MGLTRILILIVGIIALIFYLSARKNENKKTDSLSDNAAMKSSKPENRFTEYTQETDSDGKHIYKDED